MTRSDSSGEVIQQLRDILHGISTQRDVDLERLELLIYRFSGITREHYELLTEIETTARRSVSRDRMKDIYPVITAGLGRDGLGHGVMYRAKRNGASLEGIASFRSSVSMMARRRQLNRHFGPETFVTDKMHGESFARKLGLSTALEYPEVFTADSVPIVPGSVIKPRSELGSKGVFIFGKDSRIYDVQKSEYIDSVDEVRAVINALVSTRPSPLVSGRGRVVKDEWIVEKAIFDPEEPDLPARDLKFFVFYGKVAAVLEIMRFPEKKYCWWDAYGARVQTGIYDDYDWVGGGASEEELNLVEHVSSAMPAPFMRIDFLRGQEGLVLGEFSGGVGEYHRFNSKWDQKMGELFLEAEGRLMSDLLTGKKFESFNDCLSRYYHHYPAIYDQSYILEEVSSKREVSVLIEEFCIKNSIRGFVSSCRDTGSLQLVARTGSRRLKLLEVHIDELVQSGYLANAEKIPYRDAFPGQLAFQNRVR